jgi:hypothetical protein
MMRKPSCLISWSQFEPVGGFLAGDGRQGSTKPTVPRLRINMGWEMAPCLVGVQRRTNGLLRLG